MKSDTYYFSHDYNARFDEKIKLLIRKHSMLGYGCYWAIIEDLYNNANALRTDYEGIAFDLRITTEQAKSIINDFELFEFDGEYFGSKSVERRLNERNEKSVKARQSAFNRWNKVKEDANALPTQSESNTINEIKENEIKENEIKENENKEELLLGKVTKGILLNDEPIILEVEKQKEKKSTKPPKEKKTHFVPLEPLFKNIELQASYLDYLEMRTLKDKPMTQKAQELFKSRLQKLSNKNVKLAVDIINQSIFNTWIGIFEIKPDFKPKFEPKEDRRDPVLWLKKLTEKQENNILQIETPITPHKEI